MTFPSKLSKEELQKRYQRATVLLQFLINGNAEQVWEYEKLIREQLKDWNIKVPNRQDDED